MNMDKIIDYIQSNPNIFGMNIKYALLSEFFDAVANDTTTTWPVLGAVDFFPYDDNDNSWWTVRLHTLSEFEANIKNRVITPRATN
jgi:hypothetical protein